MNDMPWAIQCKNDPELFWSNSWGWVESDFDTFSSQEKERLSLPIEGEWTKRG